VRTTAATYDRLAELPVEIQSYDLERLEQPVSSEFTRVTTVIRLRGGGEEGVGEDVTYSAEDQDAQQKGPRLPLSAAPRTLDDFSHFLDELDLFPSGPALPAFLDYRRWAYESAALDLALRQARVSLGAALERDPRPVRFVASTRQTALLRPWLDLYPRLRFKLDPTSDWDERLVEEVAALDATDIVDFKGAYHGTPVDQPPDAALYERVAAAFPEALIEDPALTPDTDPVLEPHRDRISWDAPIHSVDDVERLPFPPRVLNVKPSRFGTLRRLLDFYDYCAEREIRLYGGGQFELGPGRAQIQYLAALFHADAPNDVAPGGYNAAPAPGLPESPLEPAWPERGFGLPQNGRPGKARTSSRSSVSAAEEPRRIRVENSESS
jgi:hypothetical protein